MSAVWPRLRERLAVQWDVLRCAPAARWLFIACLGTYLVQGLADRVEVFAAGISFGHVIRLLFGLSPSLLREGFIWQPLTYIFLHANVAHLLLNTLTLLLIGAALEVEVGSRRLLRVFVLGGVIGGLAWAGMVIGAQELASGVVSASSRWLHNLILRIAWQRGTHVEGWPLCIGASGAVFGLIGAYAGLFPRRGLMLLVGWPVVMSARAAAILLGMVTIAFAVLGLGHVAYLTHVAGGVAGYVYGRQLAAAGWGDDTDERNRRSD